MLLYLLIGIASGIVLGFLFFKLAWQPQYVPKASMEEASARISMLELENARRLSKEEVEEKYVLLPLHQNVHAVLETAKQEISVLHADIKGQQSVILKLTEESGQKLTKSELEKNYIAKDSFDIINSKLHYAETTLAAKEQVILDLNTQLTGLQQKEEHLNEKLAIFKEELETLHVRSREQFMNIATEVLEDKKKLFVHENKKELDTILNPFKTNLADFKEKVEATRKEDIKDMTSLKNEIDLLQKLNIQLSDDAKNLATALKSEVKMQGNWGEDRLNMILELEGLQKYIDYSREEMYRDEEQEKNRKPDFILRLPDKKCIVIDSKVSLTAYVGYFNAPTAEEKNAYLKQHIKSVTDHINNLADKNYQSLAGLTTPDYVFMFMPVEPALTLAMNQDPEIFHHALKRKIVLITPTTLVATLKVVKILWQKENQVKNVEEIFRQCGELYNKFVNFVEDMDKIETSLIAAANAHRNAMNGLKDGTKKGNTILGRLEKIKSLEARTSKAIPEKHLKELNLLPDDEPMVTLKINVPTIDTNGEERNIAPSTE